MTDRDWRIMGYYVAVLGVLAWLAWALYWPLIALYDWLRAGPGPYRSWVR